MCSKCMGNAEMEKGVNEYLCLIIFADLRFCSVPRMGQLVNWCLRLPGLPLGPRAEVPKQPGGAAVVFKSGVVGCAHSS